MEGFFINTYEGLKVNKKHEQYEKKNEKWRVASAKVIDLRYALEDILSSFTEEEKQSERYKKFVESTSQQMDHLLGDFHKKKSEDIQKKNGWLSYKSAIIAGVALVIAKAVEMLPNLISALFTIFGGHP